MLAVFRAIMPPQREGFGGSDGSAIVLLVMFDARDPHPGRCCRLPLPGAVVAGGDWVGEGAGGTGVPPLVSTSEPPPYLYGQSMHPGRCRCLPLPGAVVAGGDWVDEDAGGTGMLPLVSTFRASPTMFLVSSGVIE